MPNPSAPRIPRPGSSRRASLATADPLVAPGARSLGEILVLLICAGSAVSTGYSADLPGSAPVSVDIAGNGSVSRPDLLLANIYTPGIDVVDYWVSEKLDGVRAYWDGQRLISRGGHPIHAPGWFVAGFPPVPLDGELWMGRGQFDRTSGAVRQAVPDQAAWGDIRYMVFELPGADGTFGQRLGTLARLVAGSTSPYLAVVEQVRATDHASLMSRLDAVVAAGGEGLMLHRDASPYHGARSDDLLKVKPYLDGEARVVALLPGKGRLEGILGALLVEEPDGTRFRVGTGFTDAQRAAPPPIGSVITFKYHGRTANGVPRFASFLRTRQPADE